MTVPFVPSGYHTITPHLIVRGANDAITFYSRAFGAQEQMRLDGPGGKVIHAELVIEGSTIMLADEFPEMDVLGPDSLGGATSSLLVYLPNADAAIERAVAAGATLERPVQDQFYGDRSGTVRDPFGHRWTLATHVRDMTPEEVDEAFRASARRT